jgi:hypothetical protein
MVGAGVGFFGWLLTLAINSWFLQALLCRSADTATACANSPAIAWGAAHVIVGLFSLFVLIRTNVFRPLLVVLAAMITLWMIGLWFISMTWYVGLGWETLLFALAFMLFAWIVSLNNFVVALIIAVVVVVLTRLLIVL